MNEVKSLKQAIKIILELNEKGFFDLESDIPDESPEGDQYEAVVAFCELGICDFGQDYAYDIRESVQMVNKDYSFNY